MTLYRGERTTIQGSNSRNKFLLRTASEQQFPASRRLDDRRSDAPFAEPFTISQHAARQAAATVHGRQEDGCQYPAVARPRRITSEKTRIPTATPSSAYALQTNAFGVRRGDFQCLPDRRPWALGTTLPQYPAAGAMRVSTGLPEPCLAPQGISGAYLTQSTVLSSVGTISCDRLSRLRIMTSYMTRSQPCRSTATTPSGS